MSEQGQIVEGQEEKKAAPPEDKLAERDAEAWMDTLSDLIFLMITFFVLLITMASMDSKKLQDAFGIFNDAAGVMSYPDASNGAETMIQKLIPIANLDYDEDNEDGEKSALEDVQENAHELLKHVSDGILDNSRQRSLYDTIKPFAEKVQGDVQILRIEDGIEVVISGRLLFMPGTTQLNERGRGLLEDVAVILQLWGNNVRIVSYWPWHQGPDIMTEIIKVLDSKRIDGKLITPEIFPGRQREVRFVLKKGEDNG